MVKDIHGDNIVFVQNFARMFEDIYISGKVYPFIVNKEAYNPNNEFRYYDIRDYNGVPFRIKCEKNTFLVPNQKIRCMVSRPSLNKMILILENTKKDVIVNCISPKELLKKSGIEERCQRFILYSFATNPGFEEAKEYYGEELEKAWKMALDQEIDMLILDEAVGACSLGFIKEERLLELIGVKPEKLEVILTGRNPSKELLAAADYVTEMVMRAHPYTRGIPARKGIEY